MKNQIGITLVEMMITLTVAIILLAVAIPSYDSISANNRAVSSANRFIGAIKLARSEAINRGVSVSLCGRSAAGSLTCGGTGSWGNGWLLFTDSEGSTVGVYESTDEELLNSWEEVEGSPTMTSTTAGYLRYLAAGTRDVDNGTSDVTMTFPKCKGDQARAINISPAGYVGVTRTSC